MKSFLLSLLMSFAVVQAGWAAEGPSEIIVKDTSGVVRSVTQVEEPSNLEFILTDAAGMPADGAAITLRNELTGEEFQVVSVQGHAIFENIAPGSYVVSSSSADVTFTSVLISTGTGGALGFAGTGGALAALGGTGAAVGAGIAIARSDDDSDPELSPSS